MKAKYINIYLIIKWIIDILKLYRVLEKKLYEKSNRRGWNLY